VSTEEHATRFEPLLNDARFCAGCHQFRFEVGDALTANITQDTWREWRAIVGAKPCGTCHSTHAYEGAHSIEMLRSAVQVRARASADGALFDIEATAALGHKLPSGDLFRRLVLEVRRADRWTEVASFCREFEVYEDPA